MKLRWLHYKIIEQLPHLPGLCGPTHSEKIEHKKLQFQDEFGVWQDVPDVNKKENDYVQKKFL